MFIRHRNLCDAILLRVCGTAELVSDTEIGCVKSHSSVLNFCHILVMRWFQGGIAEAVAASKARNAIFVVFVEGWFEVLLQLDLRCTLR